MARLRRPADDQPEPEAPATPKPSERFADLRVVPGGGEWTLAAWRAAMYGGTRGASAAVRLPDGDGPDDTGG